MPWEPVQTKGYKKLILPLEPITRRASKRWTTLEWEEALWEGEDDISVFDDNILDWPAVQVLDSAHSACSPLNLRDYMVACQDGESDDDFKSTTQSKHKRR